MLIAELQKRVGSDLLPGFDAKAHAALYKAQPKERRRVVNSLVRAGGEMEYAKLLSETSSGPETIKALCALGLLSVIPGTEYADLVVLPLERLFATPLMENDPDKLVEALKVYPRDVLWAAASGSGVPVDGADEITLRARLFHRAISQETWAGLSNDALEVMEVFRNQRWVVAGERLFHEIRHEPPDGARSAETLFTAFGSKAGLGELLLNLLVVPVRVSSGSSYYRELAVPRELRARAEGLPAPKPRPAPVKRASRELAAVPPFARPKPSSDCVNDRIVELTSREGRLPGDLAKFLLLLEQDPPSITQRGTMNRRDLARLARRGGIPDREVDLLGISAACLDAVETNDEVARISKSAPALLDLPPAGLAKRLFEALPAVKFEIRYMWLAESQFERVTKAVRTGLETRLVDTRTMVCAHCVVEELAGTRALLKELGHSDEWAPKVVRLVLNTLSHMYHAAGIVEAAIDPKGVTALRLTPTGEVALGRVPVPPVVLPEEGPVIVQPSGEIIAPRSLPFADLRRLARSCDVKGVDAVAVFALNRKSLLRGAQRGEDVEALRAMIASRSKGPIPQTVKVLFDEISARMGEIEIFPCSAVVKLRDPSMIQVLGPGTVALPEGLVLLPPDVDPAKVEADLRKQGHLPRMKQAPRREEQPDRSTWVATDLDEIWVCLDDAHAEKGAVELQLQGGRIVSGLIEYLGDEVVKILPFYGGRTESVEIEGIESARPILRA
jgi:hypothetical protein